ncbi:hypothetical protein [Metabacillus halosaccharovorans]|nr:hypothetical protein [Metabacillus halosaccharovorans]
MKKFVIKSLIVNALILVVINTGVANDVVTLPKEAEKKPTYILPNQH